MMQTERLSAEEVERAVEWLLRGEPVGFPTETVYGIGAPLDRPEAIGKIFSLKGRPSDNPLIAHLGEMGDLERVALDVPQEFYRLAERFCPGPLTVVLKKHPSVPFIASGGLSTIGVRFPSHPVAQALLKGVGVPLVAPSANLSGKPSATSVEAVLEDFEGKLVAVLEGGECALGLESTVLGLFDLEHPVLLRPGRVSQEALEEVLKRRILLPAAGAVPASPGMKYRHYAPKAAVKLFTDRTALLHHLKEGGEKRRLILTSEPLPEGIGEQLPLHGSSLYAFLRYSDKMSAEEVVILCDQAAQKDAALMNRLSKAADVFCGPRSSLLAGA